MSGNEASAIGSLRTIQQAQSDYLAHCGGYAPHFDELQKLSGLNIAATNVDRQIEKNGYRFTLTPTADSLLTNDPAADCTGPITDFYLEAAPITPGSTGGRYFLTSANGTIFQDSSSEFTTATELN